MAPSSSRRTPLTAADSAWLRMEDSTNLMTITSVMTFRQPLAFEALCRRVESTFLPYDRFRMRVADPKGKLGKPAWVEADFRLDQHIVRIELSPADDRQALRDFVSQEMSTPLDFARPLWKFYFIESFRGGSALVSRIHHCIGDGISLMKVVLGMTDPEADAPEAAKVGAHGQGAGGHGPLVSGSRLLRVLKAGGSITRSLGHLLSMRADPKTLFKGPLGKEKRATWSAEIPLATVKAIGKSMGATVNDVLLAAVTETLRTYLAGRGEAAPERDVRAVVPVNIRAAGDDALGNQFGLVYLALPVAETGSRERVLAIKERMDRLKKSPEALVVYAVLKALGATHAGLQSKVIKLLSKNATAVVTNVPGPRRPLHVCGCEIDDMMFWVPQSGRLGLGVSILSYNDQVRVGVATDAGLVPDPEALTKGFERAIRELEKSALG
ncbi:MAG: wax ester/triacylglycerol synthase family O-acyltransferase [Acidobacteria bacterium]|nr:wax ester/triacylglycerol synthase family O-acyltransferase [Acidobacteriota bacterium]